MSEVGPYDDDKYSDTDYVFHEDSLPELWNLSMEALKKGTPTETIESTEKVSLAQMSSGRRQSVNNERKEGEEEEEEYKEEEKVKERKKKKKEEEEKEEEVNGGKATKLNKEEEEEKKAEEEGYEYDRVMSGGELLSD